MELSMSPPKHCLESYERWHDQITITWEHVAEDVRLLIPRLGSCHVLCRLKLPPPSPDSVNWLPFPSPNPIYDTVSVIKPFKMDNPLRELISKLYQGSVKGRDLWSYKTAQEFDMWPSAANNNNNNESSSGNIYFAKKGHKCSSSVNRSQCPRGL